MFSLIQAVIFELDGVMVDLQECSDRAWRRLAKEQGVPYEDQTRWKMRGLEDAEGMKLLLGRAKRAYSPGELMALTARKNDLYDDQMAALTELDLKPGVLKTLQALKAQGIKTAVNTTGKNAPELMRQLQPLVDSVVRESGFPGRNRASSLVRAAEKLSIAPEACLVAAAQPEDMQAALEDGMKLLALGHADACEHATLRAETLEDIDLAMLIAQRKI